MKRTINKGDALADYVEPRSYGDIIRYQEIEKVTGEKRGTAKYYAFIAKAKRLLETRGKMIVSCGGGDYQIIYPGDYTGAYAREVKLAKRRLNHGTKILRGAPTQHMSQEELAVYNRVNDFNVRVAAQFSGSVVEVKRLTGKPHPMGERT